MDYPDEPEPAPVDVNAKTVERRGGSNAGSNSRNVFVVHGHDEGMKSSVARFLEKLDLQPIILHEQPNGGKTIIEKFEANADVAFAVVLISPDDEGNEMLRKFFGSEDHYTYEYSMEEAIQKGVLCKYMYYPHLVRLTSEEMDAYVELSDRIAKYFNFDKGRFDDIDEKLKMLLLARKRIVHKAERKLDAFREIIEKRHQEKGNLKYTLVYVPEGNMPDYVGGNDDFDKSEDIGDDNDAEHLINQYTQVVTEVDDHVTVRKFISGQKDREEILYDFAEGRLQVLTSMKCLDEGVDVPRSELAIFCSSTGNPRQFIQRRGRVLRTHPDKKMAELHDLVVVPELNPNSDSFRMEQSLLRGELMRVNNFALLSENPSYSEMELRDVMNHYGLNLYNNEHL